MPFPGLTLEVSWTCLCVCTVSMKEGEKEKRKRLLLILQREKGGGERTQPPNFRTANDRSLCCFVGIPIAMPVIFLPLFLLPLGAVLTFSEIDSLCSGANGRDPRFLRIFLLLYHPSFFRTPAAIIEARVVEEGGMDMCGTEISLLLSPHPKM